MRGFRANTTEFLHTAYRLCVPNETRLPLGRSGVFRMKPITVVIFRSNLRVLANAGGEKDLYETLGLIYFSELSLIKILAADS